jgi:ribonuclease HII
VLSLPTGVGLVMLPSTTERSSLPALHLGIDEAGRGPVIGPLVLSGVWVRAEHRAKLRELGVKDSKSFGSSAKAQKRRAQLAEQVRGVAQCVVVLSVDAAEVSRRVRLGELNLLEQELADVIVQSGPPGARIVADGARLFGPLRERYPQLRALDHADQSEICVAAASILAKVERDAQFRAIVDRFEADLGPVRGGGYVNDKTAAFLRAYFERFGELPPDVRDSWDWSVLRELHRRLAGLPPVQKAEQLNLLKPEPAPESEPEPAPALEPEPS